MKKVVGAAAYVLAGLLPALRSRPFACRVRIEKQKIAFDTYQVIVANGTLFWPHAADGERVTGQREADVLFDE